LRRTDPTLYGKTILVVDDDVRNIFALTSLLEEHNMKAVHAENGRAGIELLESRPDIDLVLMDIMMPEMDGYETMSTIRKIPQFRSLPIVALTAKAMKGDRAKCLEAGASDYITKPGEDAQSFRAIAERSALPDYSKDGGEAAITPSLTREWERGQTLQTRLSERTDDDRIASLRPAGVSWIVVSRNSNTAFPCAYTNAAVKVCHLPVRPPQNSTHPEPFFEARR